MFDYGILKSNKIECERKNMKNGHYTASDIEELTIIPADKKEGTVQTAYGRVEGTKIWSNGLDFTIGEGIEKEHYSRLEKIPSKYQVVAEIIRKKASGKGGHRMGAGRPKMDGPVKKTRSFKLTEYEYMKVKEYILELRKK
ncbi:hypothetical protein [Selenomonas ruminantium]|nr:hypothetical protein [Selenomonas ruminantium]